MELNEIIKDLKDIKMRNWHWAWEPFMRKYQCDHVCELGVFKGGNFMEMIKHQPKLAVAVDTWNNGGVHSARDTKYSKKELNNQYQEFKKAVKSLPFVKIIRDDTAHSAKNFPDNYFDFVFIDADHSTQACYSDIVNWYPKVKPGKFLVGHDYRKGFGVVEAVNKFIKDNKLELIFLPPSTWAVIKKHIYKPTELCELGWKYGADKSPLVAHTYTPYYFELLKDRKYTVKKVLEMGVGNNSMVTVVRNYLKCPNAQIGASLKMWRDFFPNAWIYGADCCPESIIQDERLSTYYADLNKKEDILKLLDKTGYDLDLIIDDAWHRVEQQYLLATTIIPRLTSKNYIYIIEDCGENELLRAKLHKYHAIIPRLATRNELNSEWGPIPHCRNYALILGPQFA